MERRIGSLGRFQKFRPMGVKGIFKGTGGLELEITHVYGQPFKLQPHKMVKNTVFDHFVRLALKGVSFWSQNEIDKQKLKFFLKIDVKVFTTYSDLLPYSLECESYGA